MSEALAMPPVPAAAPARLSGRLRVAPEDFRVTELPLYLPSGEGEHVYAWIEKRELTTPAVVARLSEHLKVPQQAIGRAGYKDRHAVTRQWFSIPGIAPQDVAGLKGEGFEVLDARRHGNKLKTGHLLGNHFEITVRELSGEDAAGAVEEVRSFVANRGLPNGFGPQRFGARADNHLLGDALVRGDADAVLTRLGEALPALETPRVQEARAALREERWREAARLFPHSFALEKHVAQQLDRGRPLPQVLARGPKRVLSLLASAWQSAAFNRLLALRTDRFDALLEGDVAFKHANGASFLVEDVAAERPRLESFEISPAGPLPGPKTLASAGDAARLEEDAGARWPEFDSDAKPLLPASLLKGARRPLRVPVADLECALEDDVLRLRFSLPRGSFATALLAMLGLRDGAGE